MCNDGTSLHRVNKGKCLGLWLNSEFTVKSHIDHLLHKITFWNQCFIAFKKMLLYPERQKIPYFDYAQVFSSMFFKIQSS